MAAADRPSDAQLIARAGVSMFGDEWPAPLARALGVNPRTMQRLAAAVREGRGYPLNPSLIEDLAALLRLEAREHLAQAEALEQASADAKAR
jgi:hypothetical protein